MESSSKTTTFARKRSHLSSCAQWRAVKEDGTIRLRESLKVRPSLVYVADCGHCRECRLIGEYGRIRVI